MGNREVDYVLGCAETLGERDRGASGGTVVQRRLRLRNKRLGRPQQPLIRSRVRHHRDYR
jgi:hypothetical protein